MITIIVILTCSNLRNAFPTHGDQDILLRTKQPKYGFSKNSIAQNPVSNPFDFETKTNATYALKYTCESFQITKLHVLHTCSTRRVYTCIRTHPLYRAPTYTIVYHSNNTCFKMHEGLWLEIVSC